MQEAGNKRQEADRRRTWDFRLPSPPLAGTASEHKPCPLRRGFALSLHIVRQNVSPQPDVIAQVQQAQFATPEAHPIELGA